MNIKFLAAPVLAVLLASPAFAEVIDNTNLTINVKADQITCVELGSFSGSYVNMGKPRSRISIALDTEELSWLPVLKHTAAVVTKYVEVCPSLKEIAGEVAADGTVPVTVTRNLQKLSYANYSNCSNSRLDEKIELKLSTGIVLTSRASHSLGSDCGNLN